MYADAHNFYFLPDSCTPVSKPWQNRIFQKVFHDNDRNLTLDKISLEESFAHNKWTKHNLTEYCSHSCCSLPCFPKINTCEEEKKSKFQSPVRKLLSSCASTAIPTRRPSLGLVTARRIAPIAPLLRQTEPLFLFFLSSDETSPQLRIGKTSQSSPKEDEVRGGGVLSISKGIPQRWGT